MGEEHDVRPQTPVIPGQSAAEPSPDQITAGADDGEFAAGADAAVDTDVAADLDADPDPAPDASGDVSADVSADASADASADGALSERDRDILEFERQWWKHAGAKERAVRDRFGFSATRYFQVLNTLLDRPEALAHDPMLVQRLRRLREARQHARSTVRRTGH